MMAETGRERCTSASPEWIAACSKFLSEEFEGVSLEGVEDILISYEMTISPAHLLRDGLRPIGWRIALRNGQGELGDRAKIIAEGKHQLTGDGRQAPAVINLRNRFYAPFEA